MLLQFAPGQALPQVLGLVKSTSQPSFASGPLLQLPRAREHVRSHTPPAQVGLVPNAAEHTATVQGVCQQVHAVGASPRAFQVGLRALSGA
jgi:hypothetical protein